MLTFKTKKILIKKLKTYPNRIFHEFFIQKKKTLQKLYRKLFINKKTNIL